MFGSAASGLPSAFISSSAASAASSPAPWFAPTAATSSAASRSAASRAPTPASVSARSSNVSSATIGRLDTLPHGLDRVDQLLEVVERLDHEQVGAAAFEHGGLLGEDLAADPGRRLLAQRPDRAGDEDVPTRDLARVARELHPGRVDALEVVLQEVGGELAAVRPEGVRLDQLGARVDEADVQRHHRIRRAQVRLLGAAQARHCARDEGAHAAVGDDHGPVGQPAKERFAHAATLDTGGSIPLRMGWVPRRRSIEGS